MSTLVSMVRRKECSSVVWRPGDHCGLSLMCMEIQLLLSWWTLDSSSTTLAAISLWEVTPVLETLLPWNDLSSHPLLPSASTSRITSSSSSSHRGVQWTIHPLMLCLEPGSSSQELSSTHCPSTGTPQATLLPSNRKLKHVQEH